MGWDTGPCGHPRTNICALNSWIHPLLPPPRSSAAVQLHQQLLSTADTREAIRRRSHSPVRAQGPACSSIAGVPAAAWARWVALRGCAGDTAPRRKLRLNEARAS